jgi:hypothetical protein
MLMVISSISQRGGSFDSGLVEMEEKVQAHTRGMR